MQNTYGKAAAIATSVAMALGTFGFAAPAFAAVNSSSITISITNRGSIDNTTQADAHTGQNIALGSQGGLGGNGGSVTSAGSENNGGATAGNGGNGGNGGAGGLVTTGNASADAGTQNGLNGTDATIEFDCACGDLNSVTVGVTIDNDREFPTQNNIDNTTQARARSGQNLADGSTGGDAGTGGDVTGGSGSENNGGATSGNGGNGGSGGLGGEIATGSATSKSGSVNMLNTTILRVRM
ncbi:hypothetical protein HY971_04505 [Candidatus Kaiserbacteria bacterium]|nr:hypothetical protein [Candidatus Kaiserbacteria bacterium]